MGGLAGWRVDDIVSAIAVPTNLEQSDRDALHENRNLPMLPHVTILHYSVSKRHCTSHKFDLKIWGDNFTAFPLLYLANMPYGTYPAETKSQLTHFHGIQSDAQVFINCCVSHAHHTVSV